jgi:preprotein translocase SecE subunit
VARNRKRAKERRARRPTPTPASRRGVATARSERLDVDERSSDQRAEPSQLDGEQAERESLPSPIPDEELPSPLEHASPDTELADAQVALGRAEFDAEAGVGSDEELAEEDEEVEDYGGGAFDDGPPAGGVGTGGGTGGGELAPAGPVEPAAAGTRRLPGSRLVNFLQGSWRELQRVQWPDRRQVMQATGVVIGFVIVAGVFLGVADLIAGKVVNLIIK